MSGVDQTFSLWISFVVTRWVTLLRTWLTRSSWLQYSGATQVQLESEVGRTITPDTDTGLTQDLTNKQTDILPGTWTFPSPGKSGIAQGCRGRQARGHQTGGGDQEQEACLEGGEHHGRDLRTSALLGLY